MTGNGVGPDGCRNIDACDPYPCDDKAVRCRDDLPPQRGFTCDCPLGTQPQGEGNVICEGKSMTASKRINL